MIKTILPDIEIPLNGELSTNTQGIKRLLFWYSTASAHNNSTIYTCCKDLDWLDANLAALWSALIFKLKKENNLHFTFDTESLSNRFSILIRNGFSKPDIPPADLQSTFIRNASFGPEEDQLFSDYINAEILQQQQIKNLSEELKGLVESNLYELYMNVFRHAGTRYPFFICGQYFPKRCSLVISMVDLGQTFLPAIKRQTKGVITTQQESIEWALKGNSGLGNLGGGHALKCMNKVFEQFGHSLQIVTGDAFWDSANLKTVMGAHRKMVIEFPGTMVNFHIAVPKQENIF